LTVYTGRMSTPEREGPERDGIVLTHLDEPLFDGAGATKRDLVDYLEAVAGLIVMHVTVGAVVIPAMAHTARSR